MMHKGMCGLHKIAWVLLFIGGVNWLLVGLLEKDLFVLLGLGMTHLVAKAVYVLVGLAALAMLGAKKCCMKCDCSDKDCAHCGVKEGAMPAAK